MNCDLSIILVLPIVGSYKKPTDVRMGKLFQFHSDSINYYGTFGYLGPILS